MSILPNHAPSIRLNALRFAPTSTTAAFILRSSSSARRMQASTTVCASCNEISVVFVVMSTLLPQGGCVNDQRREVCGLRPFSSNSASYPILVAGGFFRKGRATIRLLKWYTHPAPKHQDPPRFLRPVYLSDSVTSQRCSRGHCSSQGSSCEPPRAGI